MDADLGRERSRVPTEEVCRLARPDVARHRARRFAGQAAAWIGRAGGTAELRAR